MKIICPGQFRVRSVWLFDNFCPVHRWSNIVHCFFNLILMALNKPSFVYLAAFRFGIFIFTDIFFRKKTLFLIVQVWMAVAWFVNWHWTIGRLIFVFLPRAAAYRLWSWTGKPWPYICSICFRWWSIYMHTPQHPTGGHLFSVLFLPVQSLLSFNGVI